MMGIYIATFVSSSLFLYFSSRVKTKRIRSLFAIIALLIPAILAGLRASTIGTDVRVYVVFYYEKALNSSSFIDYFSDLVSSFLSEPGYHLLNYVLSRVFKDYHWGLFFYQLISLILIYLGLKRCERLFQTPVWLGMMLYYFLLFNNSLNIMRQCMAVGFVFYGATYMFEKRYKRYVLFTVIALLFHTSSIISFVMLPMYMILQQGKSISQRKQIRPGCIFMLTFFILLIVGSQIITLLVNMGVIRAYYLEYLSGGRFRGSKSSIPYILVAWHLFLTFILICCSKYINGRHGENLFFIMSSAIITISTYSIVFVQYIDRLGYFFIPLQAAALANTYNCFAKKSKILYFSLLVLMTFGLWYYSIVLKGSHQTVPYEFFF